MGLKIYTTTNCPDCKVVKSYLLAMGANFEEVMVNSPEIAAYIEKKTGTRKVPVIENGKKVVVGFKPDEIKGLIS
ncbi:glutaredoxin family protein [Candidatus Woesearchaeota archaeon]|nr:glutaredoxin family protein [Candidatus Woesearchaeota archaeon]